MPITLKIPARDSQAKSFGLAVFLAAFMSFGLGCGQVTPGNDGSGGTLDHNLFQTSVQAILDQRSCSDAGCHRREKDDPNTGGPGGSLRLFECAATACTPDQFRANHDSAAGMANLVNPADSKLLTKPLALAQGGSQHLGGEIFQATTESDYLTVLAWIQSPL
ncbi:MAG: hypothetical protein ACE5GK_06000 [Nitrospiria bacterium]